MGGKGSLVQIQSPRPFFLSSPKRAPVGSSRHQTGMRILLTNDDGIRARGLNLLAEALRAVGEVWVVAPDREQSAASHALRSATPTISSYRSRHVN